MIDTKFIKFWWMNYENVDDIFGFIGGEDKLRKGSFTDESDENSPQDQLFAGPSKDAVIFCIDCSHLQRLMDDSESESRYQLALRTLYSFMRNKVVASDGSDMTGLIFYNVSKSDNPLKQQYIYLAQPLSVLTSKRIQDVARLMHSTESEFCGRFGNPVSDTDISELLFVCNAQFKKTSSSYRPRMFIFTDNDDPCGPDRRARKAARTRASDFHEGMSNGAEINLIPLVMNGGHFDVTKFWKEIVLVSLGDEEEDGRDQFVDNAVIQLGELNEISLKKLFKKRPLNRVNMYLGGSIKLAMMMYTSYLSTGKPRHIYLDAGSLKPLKSETRMISDLTGQVLHPHSGAGEIETYIEYQGRHVGMTKQDLVKIKQVEREQDSRGVTGSLHIVGFKPITCLKPEHCVGHSCFLFPQEARIKGSSVVVSALIERLAAKGLVAIARAVAKANSALQLVALVPQPEVVDPDTGRQEKSPGFYMIRLPFADDTRELSLPQTNVAASMASHPDMDAMRKSQVEKAKAVVSAMTEPHWEPDMLDNPSLKVCYTVLEALALQTPVDQVEPVDDLLHGDPKKIQKADSIVPEWLHALNMHDTNPCAGTANTTVYKKVKLEDDKVWTEDEVKQLIDSGIIEKLLVEQLKTIIKQVPKLRHLSSQGKKAELIQKIRVNL